MPEKSKVAGSKTRTENQLKPDRNTLVPRYSRIAYKNLDVTHVRLNRGVEPEHEHPSIQISVALNRQPMVAVERKSYGILSKQPFLLGDVCVIPSWQRHTITWDKQTEWVSFHLDPRYVKRAAEDFGVKSSIEFVSSFCRPDKRIFQYGRALGAVLRDIGVDNEPPNLYVQSLAGTLVEHLLSFYAADKTNVRITNGGLAPSKLRLIAELIDAHLERNLTIEELAQVAGLSQFHFARAFKQSIGFAPYQYIVRRRIERAKMLLMIRNLPITEIASASGFSNQSHFSQVFRRLVGASPAAYRTTTK